jgi:hypothetical protein
VEAEIVAKTAPPEIARLGADWTLLFVSPFATFLSPLQNVALLCVRVWCLFNDPTPIF